MRDVSLIEGRNAVLEALRAGMPLAEVLIADGVRDDRGLAEVERRCGEVGVALKRVDRRELDRLSERGAHQGVIARGKPYRFAALSDVIDRAGSGPALVIALDHITDPGNFGAIVRTAEVVGAAGVLVPAKRSAAVTPAAWKSAAGALAHVAVAREPNLVRGLEQLKERGFWVAGASEQADQVVWDAPMEGRLVIVMGSEGEGLARLTRERCDFLVSLPQAGNVGSLNVAQATTALAYEWVRRGREDGGRA